MQAPPATSTDFFSRADPTSVHFSTLAAIPLNWVHGRRFANINACVGDTVTFSWSKGSQHDLVEVKVRGAT